jgi:hypothetical protein
MEDKKLLKVVARYFIVFLRKNIIKYTKCHISNHCLNEVYFRCRIVLQNGYVINNNNTLAGHLEMKRSCFLSTEWALQATAHLMNVLHQQTLLQEGHICRRTSSLWSRCRQQELPLSNNLLPAGRLRCNRVVTCNGCYLCFVFEGPGFKTSCLKWNIS